MAKVMHARKVEGLPNMNILVKFRKFMEDGKDFRKA